MNLLSPAGEHIDEQGGAADAALSSRFQWFNRLGAVEEIAQELADNGGKYDTALRTVRLSRFAYRVSKMPVKQKAALKRDVVNRVKDIVHARTSADVGDRVRVMKLVPNVQLGGYRRDGRKLVEAVIIRKHSVSGVYQYTVKRLEDGQIQTGNGHMIRAIIAKAPKIGGDLFGS